MRRLGSFSSWIAPVAVALAVLGVGGTAYGQCLEGDCVQGKGRYDYGYAVYTGTFTDGKAQGQGELDFGGGERYVGAFDKGSEHGEGQYFRAGVATAVRYEHGRRLEKKREVVLGGNAPRVQGCEVGDCYNGYAEIAFPSGNRYVGQLQFGLKHGPGKMMYAGGNVLEAEFVENVPTTGTFFYAQENMRFVGAFDPEGLPLNGTYSYPQIGSTVEIKDYVIVHVHNPAADRLDSLIAESKRPQPCPACQGQGMLGGGSYTKTKEYYYTVDYVNSSGDLVDMSFGNVGHSTSTVYVPPTPCSRCNGKGTLILNGVIVPNPRY